MSGKTTRAVVVSSCGTSLITNGASQEDRKTIIKTSNSTIGEIKKEDLACLERIISEKESLLEDGTHDELRRYSAELNGILGLYEEDLSNADGNHHIFLHTDTYQGEEVAKRLNKWALSKKMSSEVYAIKSLNTANINDFNEGMLNLSSWCAQCLPGYKENGYKIIFNLIGGFKSLQGFMQTLGMFYADESIYLFEGERSLLRIPKLPIDINEEAQRLMRNDMDLFRCLARGPIKFEKCSHIPSTLLFKLEDECELSPWGRMMWDQFKPTAYGERLWPSPSDRIVFSDKFTNAASNLQEAKRRRIINERIDDLARLLEQKSSRNNLNRLDFKALKGKPCPPSTHEIDAWADQGARRIIGHYEGPSFIVDDLIPHLPT
nr:CRISPR-associated protein [uncultured Dethiosulfovibrio sp.]